MFSLKCHNNQWIEQSNKRQIDKIQQKKKSTPTWHHFWVRDVPINIAFKTQNI